MENDKVAQENNRNQYPTEPARVKAFANFFKRYMSISSVIAAALPIPVTSISLIPTYTAHIKLLSTYTPMVCFLLLGYIFYMRQSIGNRMFGTQLTQYRYISKIRDAYFKDEDEEKEQERILSAFINRAKSRMVIINVLPLFLIIASIGTILSYHHFLDQSVGLAMNDESINTMVVETVSQDYSKRYQDWLQKTGKEEMMIPPIKFRAPLEEDIIKNPDLFLKYTQLMFIPKSLLLMMHYIMFFAFAEAAFIFMAVREYIQDLLRLSDTTLLIADSKLAFNDIKMALASKGYSYNSSEDCFKSNHSN